MPLSVSITLAILPVLFATACLYILQRIRAPRRNRQRKSRFGYFPAAVGNAFQAVQAIVQPSTRHFVQLQLDDRSDADDSSDPNDPIQHLHRQAARIRRGQPIDRLTAIVSSPAPAAHQPPPG